VFALKWLSDVLKGVGIGGGGEKKKKKTRKKQQTPVPFEEK
jgi:hypothetical protein